MMTDREVREALAAAAAIKSATPGLRFRPCAWGRLVVLYMVQSALRAYGAVL